MQGKNKKISYKILVFINSVFALLLAMALMGALVNPKYLKFISLVSLGTPFLLIANLLFVIYWAVKFNKAIRISVVVLLLGYQQLGNFYSFSEKKVLLEDDVKLMSYNVRLFNKQKWIKKDSIPQKITQFLEDKNPDILCLQEYKPVTQYKFTQKYSYIKLNHKKQMGLAIFSKYPIIKKGNLDFPNTANNATFVDVIKNKDTVRIYNVHLQSLKINPKKEALTEDTKNIIKRLEIGFNRQVEQVNLLKKHIEKCKYKTIICGDFNNTAFSWIYRQLKRGKNDAFNIAGKGFGKTYEYKFPFRIDFILVDKKIEINYFKTYTKKYSDHYPIMARLQF